MEFSTLSAAKLGFLQGKSTQCAVSRLIEFLYNELDHKQITLYVFIDLRKAFETLSTVHILPNEITLFINS